MKKILITITAVLITAVNYGQTSLFDKFEDMDDVTTVVVTQDAFKMLAKFKGKSQEAKEYADMVQGLQSLRVFTTENKNIAEQMKNTVAKYLKSNSLTELMRVKDKEANVHIYVRKGSDENHVKELLMSVGDFAKGEKNAVILSLTGNIDLNKISEIIDPHVPNSKKYLQKNK